MKKALLALLGLFALAASLPASASAATSDAIAVPTSVTIFNGKLIDRIPGLPPTRPGPGLRPTGVSIPFYGRISSPHPACSAGRRYQLGSFPGSYGPFISKEELVFDSPSLVPKGGKWYEELENTWSNPIHFAVRVLPKDTIYKGASYHCEEVLSSELIVDESDFSPCKLAQAAKRGYAPSIRVLQRALREAEAHDWPVSRRYREELREARGYWPGIKRAVVQRC